MRSEQSPFRKPVYTFLSARSAVLWNLMAIVVLCLTGLCFSSEAEMTQKQQTIQKLDIVIVSTNRVSVGTNTMSLVAATNVIALYKDTLDVIVIHGSIEEDFSVMRKSSVVDEIARAGVPFVFTERNGEYAWREQSGANGIQTVKIGTDQFATLRRFWKKGSEDSKTSSGPVLQTDVDWDTAIGTYELKRVSLGLFGERVWLIHEQSQSDEKTGTIGIQLKKEW